MKCALLGFGYWGKIIEKYIRQSDRFSLKYIYSPSLNNGVSIEKIIKDKDIECIFICTPITTHYELCKLAINNGKHVFCEKPLSNNAKEIHELRDISYKKNVCIYTDYIYTNSKSINYIKNSLKEIGKIQYIKSQIKQFGKFYKEDNVYSVIGSHMISAIIYILSNSYIKFELLNNIAIRSDKNNVLDGVINFKINNDIYGSIECSLTNKDKIRTLEFIGEYGTLKFDMLSKNTVEKVLIKEEANGFSIKEENYYSYSENDNLKFAIDDFYSYIKNNESNNLDLSLKVTEVLESINSAIK